jgi:two-component system sensor histidine kinase SenX3
MWPLALLLTAVIGVVGGFAVGWWRARARTPAPPVVAPVDQPDPIAEVLREAVNHLNLGVVVSSPKGVIVYRNRSSESLSGTYAGVMLDDHVKRLMTRAREGAAADELLELHGPPRRSMMLVAEPMPNGAAVVTIQDVSEHARLDAMRTDFVANISHELKTPVGAIAVLAEALIEESDVEVVRRIAERMTNESHRAVRTIDDLLELSWIESASATDEVVDLQRVVQAAIARGQAAQSGRRIQVQCLEPARPVRLRADGRQLVSAIGNLVENAVKYSHDDAVVQVRTRVDPKAVEVMVVDQGVGIPRRDLDRIFERFYRVDKARSRATGGTGLGLSIVRHVAANHGGTVVVESREGEGSTFTLRLPRAGAGLTHLAEAG